GDRVRQLLVDGEAPGEEAVAEVIRIVRDGGYVDESLRAARARLDRASDALGRLPEGEARRVLETLGAYLLERVEAVKAYAYGRHPVPAAERGSVSEDLLQ